jgi:hypothetical protein
VEIKIISLRGCWGGGAAGAGASGHEEAWRFEN